MLLIIACIAAPPAPAREPALPKEPDTFTTFMADRFDDAFPGANAKVTGPLRLEMTLSNGAHTIYLNNIWQACETERRHCRQSINEFVANIVGSAKEESAPVKVENIRAIVRTADYADQARKMADRVPDHAPIVRQEAGELWLICVVDSPHGVRTLQRADLTKLSLTQDQAIALALKNTGAALPPLEADTHEVKKSGLKFAAGDFYESSRMLLHDSWAEISKAMGGHLVIAVPSNDVLIYGNGSGNGDRMALSAFAKTVIEKAPKPMTATLFQWTKAGWEVVVP
jgi:uncharacterized protein YtpQ (UPF0354 family)